MKLLRDHTSQNRLVVRQELVLKLGLLPSWKGLLLEFLQDFKQSGYIVIVDLDKRCVDECEGIKRLVSGFVDQLELDHEQIFF